MPQLYFVVKDVEDCFARCVGVVWRRCSTTLGINQCGDAWVRWLRLMVGECCRWRVRVSLIVRFYDAAQFFSPSPTAAAFPVRLDFVRPAFACDCGFWS